MAVIAPSLIAPPVSNGTLINGVAHFVTTSKPTVRVDGSALVTGDRWYDAAAGKEAFWNGTYWLSILSFPFTGGFTTITAAGNSVVLSGAPMSGFCDRARINWSQLGGGGTNNWSPTAYFNVSIQTRRIDSTNAVELATVSTTSTTGGTQSTPNVAWNFSDARVFAISVPSEVNDPVNGQVNWIVWIREILG